MKPLALIGLIFLATAISGTPPSPYVDSGACPFECCQYGDWRARSNIRAHARRDQHSRTIFTIRKGEKVRAITGAVVTEKPGRIRILEPMVVGAKYRFALHRGDIIFTLHYLGEGTELFWYQGRVDECELHIAPFVSKGQQPKMQLLEQETTAWWIKVRNAAGKVGWINESDFDGMDGCGRPIE